MDKVILNPGRTEFALGLLLVGATRTKTFEGMSFDPFPNFDRFEQVNRSPALKHRLVEEARLRKLERQTQLDQAGSAGDNGDDDDGDDDNGGGGNDGGLGNQGPSNQGFEPSAPPPPPAEESTSGVQTRTRRALRSGQAQLGQMDQASAVVEPSTGGARAKIRKSIQDAVASVRFEVHHARQRLADHNYGIQSRAWERRLLMEERALRLTALRGEGIVYTYGRPNWDAVIFVNCRENTRIRKAQEAVDKEAKAKAKAEEKVRMVQGPYSTQTQTTSFFICEGKGSIGSFKVCMFAMCLNMDPGS